MPWIYLFLAGLCEIAWAVGMKYSEHFTRFWPSVWTMANLLISFALLSAAVRHLPMGTAYAVWTGIGAVGTAIFGIAVFHESRDPLRLACIGLVIVGIIGLKWFSAS